MTHTKSNVLQYNEYYPFGLQAGTSWIRENSSNNFLYNGGNELNANSGWYETFFRGYDPALGRFMQIDPMATSEMATYQYAGNNPVLFNDPIGAAKADPTGVYSSVQRLRDNDEKYRLQPWHQSVFSNNLGDPVEVGYGGGGGIYFENGDLIVDFNNIDENGGTWNRNDGYRDFDSEDEALAYGVGSLVEAGVNFVIFHMQAQAKEGMTVREVYEKKFVGKKWLPLIALNDESLLKLLAALEVNNVMNLVIVTHGSIDPSIPFIDMDVDISTYDFKNNTPDAKLFSKIVASVADGGNLIFTACNSGSKNFPSLAASYAAKENNHQVNIFFNADNSNIKYTNRNGTIYFSIQFDRPLTAKPVNGWIQTGIVHNTLINPLRVSNILLNSSGGVTILE